MKRPSFSKLLLYVTLCCTLIFAFGLMAGCKGSDGSTGAAGAAGATGATGPVTLTGESCNVCHSTGQLVPVATYHPDRVTKKLQISGVSVSTSATNSVTITFHVDTNTNGTLASYTTLTSDGIGVRIADLVPANSITSPTGTLVSNLTGTLSTAYFELWASEGGASSRSAMTSGATFSADGPNGNYQWTLSTVAGSPTTSVMNVADINVGPAGHTQRLALTVPAKASDQATINRTVATLDFLMPAATGGTTTGITQTRIMVDIAACQKCHSTLMVGAAHASTYLDTKACVVCHSPLYGANNTDEPAGFMASELEADFPEFIHKIHAAIPIPAFPTRLQNRGYGAVTYPQNIAKCDVCHTGTGDMIDNWKNHPTRIACGSCHNTVNFATGAGHGSGSNVGGVQTSDAGCAFCHPATGTGAGNSVTDAHDFSPTSTLHPNPMNVPEFDVTLTKSAPTATTAYYSAGDVVDFTVTLTNHVGGTAVASSVYTSPSDSAGVSGGGLKSASIYIYGPRAKALPLTGTQSNSLFTGSTNTHVLTDANGFKYRLNIPAGTTSGTYFARVRIGDYSRVSDTDYRIESLATTSFQIGTATAEKKIDGNACVDCHGNGTAPFHDARHAVVFDTDECVSCHDLSGGHADPIANRVHAVHAQTTSSDLAVIDWSDVTFSLGTSGPTTTAASTGAKICVACHTSGNTAYQTNALGEACYGCHGDSVVVVDHMLQNGGPTPQ